MSAFVFLRDWLSQWNMGKSSFPPYIQIGLIDLIAQPAGDPDRRDSIPLCLKRGIG
jgi:hypothetical protein